MLAFFRSESGGIKIDWLLVGASIAALVIGALAVAINNAQTGALPAQDIQISQKAL